MKNSFGFEKKAWQTPVVEALGVEETLGGNVPDASEDDTYVKGPNIGQPVGTSY